MISLDLHCHFHCVYLPLASVCNYTIFSLHTTHLPSFVYAVSPRRTHHGQPWNKPIHIRGGCDNFLPPRSLINLYLENIPIRGLIQMTGKFHSPRSRRGMWNASMTSRWIQTRARSSPTHECDLHIQREATGVIAENINIDTWPWVYSLGVVVRIHCENKYQEAIPIQR